MKKAGSLCCAGHFNYVPCDIRIIYGIPEDAKGMKVVFESLFSTLFIFVAVLSEMHASLLYVCV